MIVDYNNLSDNQIIELIKQGDAIAMEFMLKKYRNIVSSETRSVYLAGAEMEDLIQEGMIGLFKAIRDYETDKGAEFSTFATTCISNQVKTAITSFNRKKHLPLNTSVSIYAENDEYGSTIADGIESEDVETNPEKVVIAREQKKDFDNRINNELSELEKMILSYFMDGLSYMEIAEKTGKSRKTVDNALQRIRNKLGLKNKD